MNPRRWGVTEAEASRPFPCDRQLPVVADAWVRAVDVDAPAATVFRWLCQLRAAPYSYDWIDNARRQSPPILTPGADRLSVGQRINVIFRVLTFEDGDHVTMRTAPRNRRFWGDVTCTLKLVEAPEGGTRLFLAMTVHSVPGPIAGPTGLYELRKLVFPWGELMMVRKQFLTLKAHAERDARAREDAALPVAA